MKKIIVLLVLCIAVFEAYSQQFCATDSYQEEMLQDSLYSEWFDSTTNEVERLLSEGVAETANTIMIPVAIHFNGAITNTDKCCLISASLAQIEVLNKDFAALNEDISIYQNLTNASPACRDAFPSSALFDGTLIQFYIATSNHPESSGLTDGDYAITIGQESWPNAGAEWSGYLNIFVEDDLEYRGIADLGGAANPNGNGIQIRNDGFGGPGLNCNSGVNFNTATNHNLGRVGTHEAGHYFGLYHVFQGSGCSGTGGDGIDDTPTQDGPNDGVPELDNAFTCETTAMSCDTQDFYMNYMDYTDDEVRVMFTTDQAAKMDEIALLGSWRTDVNEVAACGSLPVPLLSDYNLVSNCPSLEVDLGTVSLLNELPCNTQLIWSADPDPSDGIESHIGTVVTTSGSYFAYFFNEAVNCYSAPSDPVVVTASCCNDTEDFIVSNEVEVFNSPVGYGGDIIVSDGGVLRIKSLVEFGEYKKLIIQDGGKVEISGASAVLTDCPEAIRWDGIEVQAGGTLEVDEGHIHSALHAVHALSGSTVNLVDIEAVGGGVYENTRTGIWLDGSVNVGQLSGTKIHDYYNGIHCNNSDSYYHLDQGEMSGCFTGIGLSNAPAMINDFNISAQSTAINASLSPGILIESNQLNAGDYGISMWWCNSAIIKGNAIGTELGAPSTGISLFLSDGGTIRDMNIIRGERTGLFAFATDFSIIQNDISVLSSGYFNRGALTLFYGDGNQILNNYIDAQNVTFGIDTRICNGTQIENNDITTSYNATFNRAAAIKSEGSTNELIANNNVTGNGNADGIIATNTSGNTYDCNHIEVGGNKEALSVLYNSQGQSVKGNRLLADGNDLSIRSVIGEQVHEGNEFVGGNAFAEDFNIAQESGFFVNGGFDFHMPANPNFPNWFTSELVNNPYTCANTPGPNWMPLWDDEEALCAYYSEVIDSNGHNSKEYILMIQAMLRYDQYRSEYNLPACIAEDPLLPLCWVQMIEAEATIANSGMHWSPVNDSLKQQIEGLSAAYEADVVEEYLVSHGSTIAALIPSLESAKSEHDLKVDQALAELSAINCTDEIISVALPILQQYMAYLKAEDKSTFDYSSLIEYSRLCADDYGPYIQLARGIVYPIADEYFDQYDDCRSEAIEPRSASNNIGNYGTFVHPNPSKGIVTVTFKDKSSGRIEVTDVSGKTIASKVFKDQRNVSLNMMGYTGLNLIRILHHDGRVEVLKHITAE